MKDVRELHIHHREVASEIEFVKKEIEFLLKILKNCYSTSISLEKVKLLDSYWKSFEQNLDKLNLLLKKISKEEKSLAILFQDELIDPETTLFKEDHLLDSFNEIYKEVKVLKESFYEFMHGCSACSLKSPS